MTRWAAKVSPTNALPEYPRPQMTRKDWMNLNGLWNYALADKDSKLPPASSAGKILVPFSYESPLSGVRGPSIPAKRLWYSRAFTVPSAWKGERILLHLGAVNWDSTILVNGKMAGSHRGGYTGIDLDITDLLHVGENILSVSAWNPLLVDVPDAQVLGKQRDHSMSVFYTASTGIWQTVWLEPVPQTYITRLKLTPDLDANLLRVEVQTSKPAKVRLAATDGRQEIAQTTGDSGKVLELHIANPHPWSPVDPHLYGLSVRIEDGGKALDHVSSYFAMRKIALGKDEQGRTRMMLNNKFVLQIGLLDQGYWPDGTYTAPTDEALKFDIATAKSLGYNLLRKHAKVEPQRWYYWTDKLGILVWQDMPQCFGAAPGGTTLSDSSKAQFKTEWQEEVTELYNSPSIIVWTTFNEGWGQHDTGDIASFTRQLDASRLVNSATGGVDKGFGDVNDVHNYPGPGSQAPEPHRAAANGEFGGITENVEGHRWNQDKFGYGATLQSRWLASKRYQLLLKMAYQLSKETGTSAFVYTQLSDVEQEINGILTYDRAAVKFDPAILKSANQGAFPPLPPNPHPEYLPTSEDEPSTWTYTTEKPADDWMQPERIQSGWQTGQAPFGHDLWMGMRTQWRSGEIWMRRQFTISAQIPPALDLKIEYDGEAEVYLNGVQAAKTNGRSNGYTVRPITPAAQTALHRGENTLAIHYRHSGNTQSADAGLVEAKP